MSLMNRVFHENLDKFVQVLIDDIGNNIERGRLGRTLLLILQCLQENKLFWENVEMIVFGACHLR
jgi:hypothetical protein